MPVAGRGRGKFVPAKGKGKLFASGVGNLTTRDTPQSNNNGFGNGGFGNGDTGGGWGNSNGASTDAWGNVHNDTNTDRFADPGKEVELQFNVYNSNLARIIGKGGSNIQDIMAQSSAQIDINKRDSDGTITPVVIKGSQLNCDHAKKMIDEICVKFNGLCEGSGGTTSSNGGGFGGGGFGGMAAADDGPKEDEDIWIPEDKCGRVIGRGGSKIQEIQDESGANVKVHGRETAEDGKVMVTLNGSTAQRAKAKEIIERCTADRGSGGGGGGFTMPSDAEPLEMWVESCRIGRVVGKGGSKIREIQDQFSVRVDIQKETQKDDDTMVILTGSPSSTAQAKDYIDELCERSSKPDFSSGGAGGGDSWGQTDSGWGQPSSNTDSGWGAPAPAASNDDGGWGQVSGAPEW